MIRGRTEPWRLAACALLSTGALEAHADAPRPTLVVTRAPGAEDCPDANGIVARMSGMSPGIPFETAPEAPRDTWIKVEFAQALSGYRAEIFARGRRQGTRSIEDVGPGCASLSDAVAITLVMLLDPELARPPVPPAPPAPRESAPRSVPEKPVTRPAPEPRLRLGAEAGGGATVRVLEHPAPFLEGGLSLSVGRRFVFGLGGGFVFPDRVVLPSGSVELDLWYAHARAGARVVEHRGTRVLLFGGVSTGSLGGEGVDYTKNPDERLWWIAATLGSQLQAALSRTFFWTAQLMLLVPLQHTEFFVMDAGERQPAFETPAIGGALSLGILVEP